MKKLLCLLLLVPILLLGASANSEPATWARESVSRLKSQSLLDSQFYASYQKNITRAEFAYLGVKLYEAATKKQVTSQAQAFTDSNDAYVLKAKAAGIVNGYPDGSFKPQAQISRDELAVLFNNVLTVSGQTADVSGGTVFKDHGSIAPWAVGAVYKVKALGIVNGMGDNTYGPKFNATKEQALVMFTRALDTMNASGSPSVATKSLLNQNAPQFVLQDLGGQSVSLNQYKGKPLVISFVQSWSAVDQRYLESLSAYEKKYEGKIKFIVIALSSQDASAGLKDVMARYKVTQPVLVDESQSVAAAYGVTGSPAIVGLDAKGLVKVFKIGVLTNDHLTYQFDQLLK